MKEQQIRVKILPQLERFSEDLLDYYCSDDPALKYMVRKDDMPDALNAWKFEVKFINQFYDWDEQIDD